MLKKQYRNFPWHIFGKSSDLASESEMKKDSSPERRKGNFLSFLLTLPVKIASLNTTSIIISLVNQSEQNFSKIFLN